MPGRLPVRVARRASKEILDAAEWWCTSRPAAPDAFREEMHRAFELLSAQPRIGTLARNVKLPGVRRVHLARVRYHLYYRVTSSAVEILALWHTSRSGGPDV